MFGTFACQLLADATRGASYAEQWSGETVVVAAPPKGRMSGIR